MALTSSDKIYANALKALRKKHGLIQYAVAEHLGFSSQQQYSDLEKGKKHFTEEIIIKICRLFDISVLEFVNQPGTDHSKNFLRSREYLEVCETHNVDLKLTLYKKLYLESKIENIEARLKALGSTYRKPGLTPCKHKIHVII